MVSNVSVTSLADGIIVFASDIDPEVLADVNASVFAAVITALDFVVPTLLEELGCRAAFDC